jgi:hypothetical protein
MLKLQSFIVKTYNMGEELLHEGLSSFDNL